VGYNASAISCAVAECLETGRLGGVGAGSALGY